MKVMRVVRVRAFAVVGALMLLVTACGGDADDGSQADGAQETEAATETSPATGTEAADETEGTTRQCDELRPATIAVPAQSLNFVAYYQGVEQGFFEAQCIDATIEQIRSDAAIAGIIEGSVHFTAAGGSAMRAALEGAPLRAIMVTVGESTTSVVTESEITTAQDLKGASIAILGRSDSLAIALGQYMEDNDMSLEQDVELLSVNATSEAFSSLLGGSVSAATLTPPFTQQAEAEGFNVLVKVSDFFPGSQAQVATSVEMIENDPEFVKDFIRAALESIRFMADNEEQTREFVVGFLELEPDIADAALQEVRPALATDGQVPPEALLSQLPPGTTEEQLNEVTDFALLEEVLSE